MSESDPDPSTQLSAALLAASKEFNDSLSPAEWQVRFLPRVKEVTDAVNRGGKPLDADGNELMVWFLGHTMSKMTGMLRDSANLEESLTVIKAELDLCGTLITNKLALEGALAFTQILLGEGPPLDFFYSAKGLLGKDMLANISFTRWPDEAKRAIKARGEALIGRRARNSKKEGIVKSFNEETRKWTVVLSSPASKANAAATTTTADNAAPPITTPPTATTTPTTPTTPPPPAAIPTEDEIIVDLSLLRISNSSDTAMTVETPTPIEKISAAFHPHTPGITPVVGSTISLLVTPIPGSAIGRWLLCRVVQDDVVVTEEGERIVFPGGGLCKEKFRVCKDHEAIKSGEAMLQTAVQAVIRNYEDASKEVWTRRPSTRFDEEHSQYKYAIVEKFGEVCVSGVLELLRIPDSSSECSLALSVIELVQDFLSPTKALQVATEIKSKFETQPLTDVQLRNTNVLEVDNLLKRGDMLCRSLSRKAFPAPTAQPSSTIPPAAAAPMDTSATPTAEPASPPPPPMTPDASHITTTPPNLLTLHVFRYSTLLRFARSTVLSQRLSAMNQIVAECSETSPESLSIFLQWLRDAKPVEMLLSENLHLEVVRRALALASFEARQGPLAKSLILAMWKASRDEVMMSSVHTTLVQVVPSLSASTFVWFLEEHLAKLPLLEYDEAGERLRFIYDVTLAWWDRSNSKALETTDVQTLYILWRYAQDGWGASLTGTRTALELLNSLLARCPAKRRVAFIEQCVSNVQKGDSVPQSLLVMEGILSTFPSTADEPTSAVVPADSFNLVEKKSYFSFGARVQTRRAIITGLESKHKFVKQVVSCLVDQYHPRAMALAKLQDQDAIDQMCVDKTCFDHLEQVRIRLNFLSFLWTSSQLKPTLPFVESLWQTLVVQGLSPDSRDAALQWFGRAHSPLPSSPMATPLSPVFYADEMGEISPSNSFRVSTPAQQKRAALSRAALSDEAETWILNKGLPKLQSFSVAAVYVAVDYLLSVNKKSRLIKAASPTEQDMQWHRAQRQKVGNLSSGDDSDDVDTRTRRALHSVERTAEAIIALELLWRIVLTSAEDGAQLASDLLARLHIAFSGKIETKAGEVKRLFCQSCLDRAQSTILKPVEKIRATRALNSWLSQVTSNAGSSELVHIILLPPLRGVPGALSRRDERPKSKTSPVSVRVPISTTLDDLKRIAVALLEFEGPVDSLGLKLINARSSSAGGGNGGGSSNGGMSGSSSPIRGGAATLAGSSVTVNHSLVGHQPSAGNVASSFSGNSALLQSNQSNAGSSRMLVSSPGDKSSPTLQSLGVVHKRMIQCVNLEDGGNGASRKPGSVKRRGGGGMDSDDDDDDADEYADEATNIDAPSFNDLVSLVDEVGVTPDTIPESWPPEMYFTTGGGNSSGEEEDNTTTSRPVLDGPRRGSQNNTSGGGGGGGDASATLSTSPESELFTWLSDAILGTLDRKLPPSTTLTGTGSGSNNEAAVSVSLTGAPPTPTPTTSPASPDGTSDGLQPPLERDVAMVLWECLRMLPADSQVLDGLKDEQSFTKNAERLFPKSESYRVMNTLCVVNDLVSRDPKWVDRISSWSSALTLRMLGLLQQVESLIHKKGTAQISSILAYLFHTASLLLPKGVPQPLWAKSVMAAIIFVNVDKGTEAVQLVSNGLGLVAATADKEQGWEDCQADVARVIDAYVVDVPRRKSSAVKMTAAKELFAFTRFSRNAAFLVAQGVTKALKVYLAATETGVKRLSDRKPSVSPSPRAEQRRLARRCEPYFLLASRLAETVPLDEDLFRSVAHNLMTRVPCETYQGAPDHLLVGFTRLVRGALRNPLSQDAKRLNVVKNLVPWLLNECLFAKGGSRLSFSKESRSAAFGLLTDLCLTPFLQVQPSTTTTGAIPAYPDVDKMEYVDTILKLYCESNCMRTPSKKRSSEWGFDPHGAAEHPLQYAGLENAGTTCYMNSTLQQLFHVPTFAKALVEFDRTRNAFIQGGVNTSAKAPPANPESSVIHHLQVMFASMSVLEARDPAVETKGFCSMLKEPDGSPIDVGEQKDAEEFFQSLFNTLEEEGAKNVVKEHFGGTFTQLTVSQDPAKPYVGEKIEPFYLIQLDIKGKRSLNEALESFVAGTRLVGDNRYELPSGEKVEGLVRSLIRDLPPHLCIQLKRLEFHYETMSKVKINDYCSFPMELDMEPYTVDYAKAKKKMADGAGSNSSSSTDQDASVGLSEERRPKSYYRYELSGILVHSGNGDSGHYYSFIRERVARDVDVGRAWYEFNDHMVWPYSPDRIPNDCFGGIEPGGFNVPKQHSAYILVYDRVPESSVSSTFSGMRELNSFRGSSSRRVLSGSFKVQPGAITASGTGSSGALLIRASGGGTPSHASVKGSSKMLFASSSSSGRGTVELVVGNHDADEATDDDEDDDDDDASGAAAPTAASDGAEAGSGVLRSQPSRPSRTGLRLSLVRKAATHVSLGAMHSPSNGNNNVERSFQKSGKLVANSFVMHSFDLPSIVAETVLRETTEKSLDDDMFSPVHALFVHRIVKVLALGTVTPSGDMLGAQTIYCAFEFFVQVLARAAPPPRRRILDEFCKDLGDAIKRHTASRVMILEQLARNPDGWINDMLVECPHRSTRRRFAELVLLCAAGEAVVGGKLDETVPLASVRDPPVLYSAQGIDPPKNRVVWVLDALVTASNVSASPEFFALVLEMMRLDLPTYRPYVARRGALMAFCDLYIRGACAANGARFRGGGGMGGNRRTTRAQSNGGISAYAIGPEIPQYVPPLATLILSLAEEQPTKLSERFLDAASRRRDWGAASSGAAMMWPLPEAVEKLMARVRASTTHGDMDFFVLCDFCKKFGFMDVVVPFLLELVEKALSGNFENGQSAPAIVLNATKALTMLTFFSPDALLAMGPGKKRMAGWAKTMKKAEGFRADD